MTSYVAFLRAVNVGGQEQASRWPKLRDALTDAGLEEVATVLQSGNVVFRSRSPPRPLRRRRRRRSRTRSASTDRRRRSARQRSSTAVAAHNPFLDADDDRDPKTLHVAVLSARPTADGALRSSTPTARRPTRSRSHGREVYLSYPSGSGRTRLTLDYLERTLGVRGTARNWRTVQRLATLLAGLSRAPASSLTPARRRSPRGRRPCPRRLGRSGGSGSTPAARATPRRAPRRRTSGGGRARAARGGTSRRRRRPWPRPSPRARCCRPRCRRGGSRTPRRSDGG